MRKYRGDVVAIAAIVAGALGSYALYQRAGRSSSETVVPVVGPRGLILSGPSHAPAPRLPGPRVLHFRTAEPEGAVYLVRPGAPDLLVTPGTNVLLGPDGLFEGVFRTHGILRKVHIEVELLSDGKVTSSASVSALHPHVDVTRRGLDVFGS